MRRSSGSSGLPCLSDALRLLKQLKQPGSMRGKKGYALHDYKQAACSRSQIAPKNEAAAVAVRYANDVLECLLHLSFGHAAEHHYHAPTLIAVRQAQLRARPNAHAALCQDV